MKNWQTQQYRHITNAILRNDTVIVCFGNGDIIEVATGRLSPGGLPKAQWQNFRFDDYSIYAKVGLQDVEVPWSTIRSLTDPLFSAHSAERAEEQARNIGIRIRGLRENKGLTAKELAARAGISPQSLSRIENGKHDVVFTTLQRILGAMGCTLRDLAELESQSDVPSAKAVQKRQASVWTPQERPFGTATTRDKRVEVFSQEESDTTSNTTGSNTPSIEFTAA